MNDRPERGSDNGTVSGQLWVQAAEAGVADTPFAAANRLKSLAGQSPVLAFYNEHPI